MHSCQILEKNMALPDHYVVLSTGYEENLTDCVAGAPYIRLGDGGIAAGFQAIVNEIKATCGVCDDEVIMSSDSFDFDVVQSMIDELKDWDYCRIRGVTGVSKYNLTNGKRVMVVNLDAEAG